MKKYIITIAFLAGLLITLSVLLYPFVANYVNSRSQTRVVTQYIDDVAAIDDGRRQAILDEAHEYNMSLLRSTSRFRPTDKEKARYLKQLDTDRGVMGILAISKIDVSLPIYHGTDEGVLQVGLGHMQGTSLPVGGAGTHAFITGHRGLPSSKLLSNLDKLGEGDIFTLYILGETLTYRVDNIQTVEPHVVEALAIDPEMDHCTLVTCTPYGVNTHRLLVRGRRIETPLSAGWDALYADAKYLEKPLVILLFMAPVLPILMIAVIFICRKIRKRR